MKKHAYLIMAHDNIDILNLLICSLDDVRNDIYLHIDKKMTSFEISKISKLKYSNLLLIDRKDIQWGGLSQTSCEIDLYKESSKKHYDYYHLLSGVDFPIISQDDIHAFFNKNNGLEFVGFDKDWNIEKVKYRNLFVEIGRDFSKSTRIKQYLNGIFIKAQKVIGFKNKDFEKISKGANWCSLTHNLVEYILENEEYIYNYFKAIQNSDELYKQTLIANSKYFSNVYCKEKNDEYLSNMRCIDWDRGNPYTFTEKDIEYIANSGKLFVRKVDTNCANKLFAMLKK